jgi:hypothetical protein
MAGCAKTIQINRGVTVVAQLPGIFAKIRGVIKIRIFFFYPSIVVCSPEEENRQLEKLHLTLSSSIRFSISSRVTGSAYHRA